MIRKLLWLVAAVAVAGLFVACEIEEDGDADGTTGTPDGTVDPPTCDPACAAGETCVSGVCQPGTVDNLPYRYVRIDDTSDNGSTDDAGADIDAIILFKAGGGTFYADNVEAFAHAGGPGAEVDPEESLGSPDAFPNYTGVGMGTDTCDGGSGYVSMGGTGGMLIVHMEGELEAGDTLSALEVGDCDMIAGGTAIADDVNISVSVSNSVDGTWQIVASGSGPEITTTLEASDLPAVPQN